MVFFVQDTFSYVIVGDIIHVNYGQFSETIIKSDYINSSNEIIQNNQTPQSKLASVVYGSTVRCKFDDRYYYNRGVSGAQDYVKIGCNLDYQIRYDTLSQTRKNNVNTYIDGINKSNSHYNSAVGYVGAEAAGGALIAAIAPEALFVAIVAAGFTGTQI